MKDMPLSEPQQEAAQKFFQWLECARDAVDQDAASAEDQQPNGMALPPHERGCGCAYPIRGTNHEDLAEWCRGHET